MPKVCLYMNKIMKWPLIGPVAIITKGKRMLTPQTRVIPLPCLVPRCQRFASLLIGRVAITKRLKRTLTSETRVIPLPCLVPPDATGLLVTGRVANSLLGPHLAGQIFAQPGQIVLLTVLK